MANSSNLDDRKIFFLAVNTGFVASGEPTNRYIDFYRQRSSNGLYSAIVGNVVIPDGFGSNAVCAIISRNDAWRRVAEAIRVAGAKPGLQLASAWQGYKGNRKFVPKSRSSALSEYMRLARAVRPVDVERSFESLMKGSEIAAAQGFSHLQLHAAHGYLFNLLLDARFSDIATLAHDHARRWALQMAKIGVETSVRVSLLTGEAEFDAGGSNEVLQNFCDLGVDYIDLSEGFYNVDKRLIYPANRVQYQDRLSRSLDAARMHPNQAFITSGKVLQILDGSLPSNVHIGLCRDLIANPFYLAERHKGCTNCMKCHYHSRGGTELTCSHWNSPTSPPTDGTPPPKSSVST